MPKENEIRILEILKKLRVNYLYLPKYSDV